MISLRPTLRCVLSLVLATGFILSGPSPSPAEINPDLVDRYLQREFDWAMYLDVQELKHYLDYRGSRLTPITRVRVSYRPFPRSIINVAGTDSSVYEEFWYHNGKVLGVRRRKHITIPPYQIGAIVVSPKPDGSLDKAENTEAIANVVLRLMVDLQIKDAVTSVVMVPTDRYYEVAQGLSHYGFRPDSGINNGQQMSIHLRAHPQGPDEYLFYQRGN